MEEHPKVLLIHFLTSHTNAKTFLDKLPEEHEITKWNISSAIRTSEKRQKKSIRTSPKEPKRIGIEKKKKEVEKRREENTTSALHRQLEALSSYKYMFYASYFSLLRFSLYMPRLCHSHILGRAYKTKKLSRHHSSTCSRMYSGASHKAKNSSLFHVKSACVSGEVLELPFWICLACGWWCFVCFWGRKNIEKSRFMLRSFSSSSPLLFFPFPMLTRRDKKLTIVSVFSSFSSVWVSAAQRWWWCRNFGSRRLQFSSGDMLKKLREIKNEWD